MKSNWRENAQIIQQMLELNGAGQSASLHLNTYDTLIQTLDPDLWTSSAWTPRARPKTR